MLKIGLAGFGFIGKTHLEAYKKIPNAEVTAICTSGNKEGLNEFTGAIFSNYDALLRREDIDVIDICVPTYLHERYILKAAKAKKHIICEKPLTLNVESANRIIHAVEKAGVRLFVGHLLRFWPEYQWIKAFSGTIEQHTIDTVYAKRLGTLPKWSEWFKHPEKSGGALFDLHIHDIDFIYHLLGEAKSVYAVGKQNCNEAWDHIMTTLTFKNGTKAFAEASHRMPAHFPFTMSLRMQADQKMVDFQLEAGANIEHINNSRLILYDDEKATNAEVAAGDAFQNELAYFIDCLENDNANEIIPLQDVRYVIHLLQAIETSLRTGRVITLG
ncbi:Gfo/Idh/MocA family protein [Oceanobacillus alkalisoli]|uniref:Gfo/Idh/MocA family protein n=1 Tax=Oceanobacillus alkalisoli TaxID=2925113 RepID=UPI001F11F5D0|nr:Gfo/Idh/MocA family oxidoreductase [Oceanobacillus alkalisoli]MCF3944693.1 Gfo/Idh/MocA family oxidoreductase [Oceanobacillus alkalisoli]